MPQDNIEVGLGTKVGLLAAGVGAVVAAVAAIADGDQSEETITGLIVAAITVYGVVRSRGDQAAALYRDAPSPAQMDDFSGDDDVPDDETLAAQSDSPFEEPVVDAPLPEGAVGGKPVAEAR